MAGMGDDEAVGVPDIPGIPEAAEPAEASPLDAGGDESARSYVSTSASRLDAADDLVAAAERTRALAELAAAAKRRLQEAKAAREEPVQVEVEVTPVEDPRAREREAREQAAETAAEYFAETRGPYEERVDQDRWIDDYSGGLVLEPNPPEEQQEMAQDSIELGRNCAIGCAIIGLLTFAAIMFAVMIGAMR